IAEHSRSYVRIRSPQRERLLDVLSAAGITPARTADEALEVDGDQAEAIGELAARHQIVLHELSPQRASLEEAFMRLTAESVEYHAHDGQPPAEPPTPQRAWGSDWR
ncbi:ABC transporter ATP-binding protein, partial [Streptomyces sp. TRM76130]|nr:ABC transporter ATP-binding protein [Streptomyces sp. TRM76130]